MKIRIGSRFKLMSYSGKITTVGSSNAIRIDKDLFRQHPEFRQQAEVKADVISPGKMLISVENIETKTEYDPVLNAFLSFLESDMVRHPRSITAIDTKTIKRAKFLTTESIFTDADFK